MSGEGVHANIKVIQDLEAACARFASTVVDRLPEIRLEIKQVTEALSDRRSDLRREIADLEERISSAGEDDDVSSERRRLEEAEDDLASVQRRMRKVADASADYMRRARNAEELVAARSDQIRAFLTETEQTVRAYLTHSVVETTNVAASADMAQRTLTSGQQSTDKIPEQPDINDPVAQKKWADVYLHPDNFNLTGDERDALAYYQWIGYSGINASLRGYVPLKPDERMRSQKIDSAIDKSTLSVDLVLFRGVDESVGNTIHVGRPWFDKAFQSTSLSIKSAHKRDVLVEIQAPVGSKGIYLDELHKKEDGSSHGGEIEVLLARNTQLEILQISKMDDGRKYVKAKIKI